MLKFQTIENKYIITAEDIAPEDTQHIRHTHS
jgi:hypothetical protein